MAPYTLGQDYERERGLADSRPECENGIVPLQMAQNQTQNQTSGLSPPAEVNFRGSTFGRRFGVAKNEARNCVSL